MFSGKSKVARIIVDKGILAAKALWRWRAGEMTGELVIAYLVGVADDRTLQVFIVEVTPAGGFIVLAICLFVVNQR